MKRKSIVAANKKGLNYYSPLIAIMGILVLGVILSNLFVKQNRLASEFDLGREQFRILLAHSSAEKTLLFVDDAAKLALENAAYKYGKSGFHSSVPVCGSNNGFNYWTKEQSLEQNDCVPQLTPCHPDESTMKSTFRSFFSTTLESFVKVFNEKSGLKVEGGSLSVPFSYEEFTLSPVVGRTEIIGKSKEPITITAAKTNKLVYEIKPSFRESITPDVSADGKEVASKAPQLLRKGDAETKTILNGFNSQNPALQWELDSYLTPSSSCSHVIGTCAYDCNCQEVCGPCGEDGKGKCCSIVCETCYDGKLTETVSYKDVYAAFSVANGKGFYVSDPPSSQPQLKDISYDFGLNWLEETARGTTCVPP